MKVRVSELRQAANVLFDHLDQTGHSEIEIDQDYYWNIPDESLHAVEQDPSGFTIGQLSENLENVRAMGAGKKPPVAYGLVWLSTILRFIGAKIIS